MNKALIERTLAAMERGYMHQEHAEYCSVMEALKAELEKPDPEPVAIYRFSHLLGEYGVKWLITSELPDGTLLYTKDQL